MKAYGWKITREKPDQTEDSVIYNSLVRKPVDKEHVLNSPAIRRWLNETTPESRVISCEPNK